MKIHNDELQLIEAMARAIAIQHGAIQDDLGPAQRNVIESNGVTTIAMSHVGPLWKLWVDDATAALNAIKAQGMQIVPVQS